MNIYVGNLPYRMASNDLEALFGVFGPVSGAKVVLDRDHNNRSKGFGFVEMDDEIQAQAAIAALNGKDIDGRPLRVNEARPKTM